MIELIILIVVIIVLVAIMASGILVIPGPLGTKPIPGVGYQEKGKIIRSCAVYQTYSIETEYLDTLTSYPLQSGLCNEGSVRALEKVSFNCDRDVGCIDSVGNVIKRGQANTFYQTCGKLPLCTNLSINISHQDDNRCVSLQERILRATDRCTINDSYVYQEEKIRIPTQNNCLSQNLSFIPCANAPTWIYANNKIYSGSVFLTTVGNSVTTTTNSREASNFLMRYAINSI